MITNSLCIVVLFLCAKWVLFSWIVRDADYRLICLFSASVFFFVAAILRRAAQ